MNIVFIGFSIELDRDGKLTKYLQICYQILEWLALGYIMCNVYKN